MGSSVPDYVWLYPGPDRACPHIYKGIILSLQQPIAGVSWDEQNKSRQDAFLHLDGS